MISPLTAGDLEAKEREWWAFLAGESSRASRDHLTVFKLRTT
jgi:hypothetical protein